MPERDELERLDRGRLSPVPVPAAALDVASTVASPEPLLETTASAATPPTDQEADGRHGREREPDARRAAAS